MTVLGGASPGGIGRRVFHEAAHQNMAEHGSLSVARAKTVGAMLVESLLPSSERPRKPSLLGPMDELEGGDEDSDASSSSSDGGRRGGDSGGRNSALKKAKRTSFHSNNSHSHLAGAADRREIRGRIMDREGLFGQSKGHWELGTVALRKEAKETEVRELFLMDWYHAFLDTKFTTQMLIFAFAYVVCFCLFALLFLVIAEPCNLNLEGSFIRAYLLALETMMTIGYGVPDPYMKGCWQAPVVLTVQTLLQLLMAACLVGVVFQGISRPQARACTILFSDQAVIRCIDGVHYLMLRICDLRIRHSLIEAHVRCYCVHQHPEHGYQTVPLRLEHPDDDLGASLLLTLPSTVVHRIDAWSPLAPYVLQEEVPRPQPTRRRTSSNTTDPQSWQNKQQARDHHRTVGWPGTLQRQVDCEAGNRMSCVCPTCGSSFGTALHLQLHSKYCAKMDISSGVPPEHCHKELKAEDLQGLTHEDPSREELHTHLALNYSEVVVMVEGIEPTTSSTLQARHSYVTGGLGGETDVAWDMAFAECIRVPHEGNAGLMLDLGRFHMLVPADNED